MSRHSIGLSLLALVFMTACQNGSTTTTPTLAQIATNAFASGKWRASGVSCREPKPGYYARIGAARTYRERDAAFTSMGYQLVPHPRKAGRMTISDAMPQKVRVDYHATSSALGGDMDPHDIRAMSCFTAR